jgi:hypothetical protein
MYIKIPDFAEKFSTVFHGWTEWMMGKMNGGR